MKQYKIITFQNTADCKDLLIAMLSSIDFDSFEEKENEVIDAYIEDEMFDETSLKTTMSSLPVFENVCYKIADLENKNWNAEWESNFKPIIVDDTCAVRASFHAPQNTKYELVIEPRMAFGTGHHATTAMMISLMLALDFEGKEILDFGTGTGILSLLAEMKGATSIFANDIEEPAVENVIINAKLNNCNKIQEAFGGIEVVPKKEYDIILANVNTLAIEENLTSLETVLKKEGVILLSGILIEHQSLIEKLAKELHFALLEKKEQNNWTAFLYKK